MIRAIVLALILSTSVLAQVTTSTAPGEINCVTDDTTKATVYCHYTIKYLAKAQTLVKKVQQAILQGNPLLPPEGILEPFGENDKVLVFSHKDKDVLEKMKSIIPLLDSLEDFSTNIIVELKTEIFQASETGLSNLGAEITNLRVGAGVDDLTGGNNINSDGNGLGFGLQLGAVALEGVLSAERSKGTMHRMATIVRAIPNLGQITYSDRASVFFAPGVGSTTITEKKGISLEGQVSVKGSNKELVNIKGFHLHYGTITSEGLVNTVSIPYDNLVMQEGIAYPLVSSQSIGRMEVRSGGLLNIGRSTSVESSKLMMYNTVKVYEWDEYVTMIKELLVVGKTKFNEEEIDAMETNCTSLSEILKDIALIAKRDLSGDPVLSIKLKKKYACPENIKTKIQVKIRGEGIDKDNNSKFFTVERLMHVPMMIDGIGHSKFSQPKLDFKLKLKSLDEEEETVKLKLRFAPNKYDIEDMFWILN